jgi:hypothetical protein
MRCKTRRGMANSGGTRSQLASVSPPYGRIACAVVGSALLLTATATLAQAQVTCSYTPGSSSGGYTTWQVTATNVPDPAGTGSMLTVTYYKNIPQDAPAGSGGPANVTNTTSDPPLTATGYGNNNTSFHQGQVSSGSVYNPDTDIETDIFLDTAGGFSNDYTPIGWVNSHDWGNVVTGSGHSKPTLSDGSTDNSTLDSDATGQSSVGALRIIVNTHNTCGL